MLSSLARRALHAYGGEDRWHAATAVRATITARGFAFYSKMRRGVKDVRFECTLARPHVISWPVDGAGNHGVFDGGTVRIESPDGRVLASRADPRRGFPYGRRLFYWDRLDAFYFCAYASWNYLTFPALLLREDIVWRQLSDTTLEARFPVQVPTHSAVQQFHFEADSGLLRQHDYTAEVFGGWARAANVVLEHHSWEGIRYPSRRRVTPRRPDGRPRAFPLLVAIDITDWQLV